MILQQQHKETSKEQQKQMLFPGKVKPVLTFDAFKKKSLNPTGSNTSSTTVVAYEKLVKELRERIVELCKTLEETQLEKKKYMEKCEMLQSDNYSQIDMKLMRIESICSEWNDKWRKEKQEKTSRFEFKESIIDERENRIQRLESKLEEKDRMIEELRRERDRVVIEKMALLAGLAAETEAIKFSTIVF